MSSTMSSEEPLPSGWLPPRAPVHPTSPEAPPRPTGDWPPVGGTGGWPGPPQPAQAPSSPLAASAIAVGSVSILLLVFSAGISYAMSLVLGLVSFTLARQVQ